jgi:hypothetical protein
MRAILVALACAVPLALSVAAPAGAQTDGTRWLCLPGQEPNPCRESLETTVYSEGGESHVENPPLAENPPIDCFYIYPTVSEDPAVNSDGDADDEEVAIARYQAGRFSEACRVFAPLYRQVSLIGLQAPSQQQAAAFQLGYSDVLSAWREYLANHNDGRGVVLIGHSQGTRMLRHLLRTEIDPDPDARRLLVSALLLGGNVTVREGELAGGDFENVPGCTSPDQIGCVVAYSTYDETPPSNARYGRPTSAGSNPFNFPTGPGYEVLCTNPASLTDNAVSPLSTLVRSEPYPGFIGALLLLMYGGLPPTAPTPWVQPQDHYAGQCVRDAGAHVLKIEPIANARDLNASPEPSWGLHLADVNIAAGSLVEIVLRQAAAHGRFSEARCGKRRVTMIGSEDRDVLRGTPGADVISAQGGNDRIRGLRGKDVVCGGAGTDRLSGGGGRDQLLAGQGRDRCRGGGGRDKARSCRRRSGIP